jgi:pre-mRNA-processing factor SLU7
LAKQQKQQNALSDFRHIAFLKLQYNMADRSSTSTGQQQQHDVTAAGAGGGGVAMINPHNPEFITKRPWYLGSDAAASSTAATSAATTAPIGLDHQAADVRLEKLPRSLATSEALLEQERQQQERVTSSQRLRVGMWLEALKRNKPPYRMGQVKRVSQIKNGTVTVVDVQFEDGTLERAVPTTRLRWTKAGARSRQVDASLYGKETYDAKRDMYHGYDRNVHHVQVERKFATRDELRKEMRQQQLLQKEQQEQQEQQDNKNDDEEEEEGGDAEDKKDKDDDNDNEATTSRSSKKNKKKEQQQQLLKNKKKEQQHSDSDSDSDHDSDREDHDDDSSDDEFVQRDEDARVHTSRLARQGGVGGAQMKVTARNLRIREDTAKYLRNLNPNSAYYDPKSRSMRDNPTPQLGSEAAYVGDNFVRISGDAIKLAETQLFAWDAAEQQQDGSSSAAAANNDGATTSVGGAIADLHPQANPTQAEMLQRQHKSKTANVKLEQKKAVLAKYGGGEYLDGSDGLAKAITADTNGNGSSKMKGGLAKHQEATTAAAASLAAAQERKIRFGVSTSTEEYTRDGRIKGDKDQDKNIKRVAIPSKYEEDIWLNGHVTVWGSYFHVGAFKWGYADDHSLIKNSYCTGENGRRANDEANEMQYGTGVAGSAALAQARGMLQHANSKLLQAAAGSNALRLNNSSQLYGEADAKATANLDPNKLQQALTKEDLRLQQEQREKDDRKRKYNSVDTQVDVTEEEMEAYRLRKERSSDPMAKLAASDELLDYQK